MTDKNKAVKATLRPKDIALRYYKIKKSNQSRLTCKVGSTQMSMSQSDKNPKDCGSYSNPALRAQERKLISSDIDHEALQCIFCTENRMSAENELRLASKSHFSWAAFQG